MILFRYIAKEIYTTTLGIVVVLLLILLSAQFLHYLGYVAEGRITITVLLKIMGLEVPLLLGYVLPLSFFLGVLMAIGGLCEGHEIVVMQSCGVSHAKLLGMVSVVAVVMMVVVATLMFYIEPMAQWYRIKLQDYAKAAYSIQKIMPGEFQTVNGMTIYVKGASANHSVLKGVFVAVKEKASSVFPKGYWQVITAQSATQYQNPKTLNNYVELKNGYRYQGVPGQLNYRVTHFGTYAMLLTQGPSSVGVKERIKFTPTLALLHQVHSPHAIAELQWRLAMPLSVLILALLAVPLSYVNPRHGKFGRFFPGLMIYLIYINLIFVCRDWIYNGTTSPLLGMWWLHGVLLIIALIYTANHVGWRRFVRLGRCDY